MFLSLFRALLSRMVCRPFALVLILAGFAHGQAGPVLAPQPTLGWNSWDSYGLRITEQQFRDNAKVLATRLKPFGYNTAVIDEGWFLRNPEARPHPEQLQFEIDGNGRYLPVPARFPGSMEGGKNLGFKQLSAWLHAQGLQFGIHIVRGIPRESVKQNLPIEGSSLTITDAADQSDACPWDPTNWGVKDNAAGQAWYDSLLRQYAAWGVDFLKVDCIADHPYRVSEIRQIHLAIQHSGRPIILSLSPGPTQLVHAQEVGSLAQMWRISDDIWDIWDGDKGWPRAIKRQFEPAAEWVKYAHPGNWPDADMLPVGELRPYPDVASARHTRLTPDEQHTQISLWAFARSPLIVGANLTLLDRETEQLLTNRDILAIDQNALASRQLLHQDNLVIWSADLPGGRSAVGMFNLGESAMPVSKSFADLKLPAGNYTVRNAWEGGTPAERKSVDASVPAHGVVVLILERRTR